MKVKSLGMTRMNSRQYVVLGECNEIVAVFFRDMITKLIYKIHILIDLPTYANEVMEFIKTL